MTGNSQLSTTTTTLLTASAQLFQPPGMRDVQLTNLVVDITYRQSLFGHQHAFMRAAQYKTQTDKYMLLRNTPELQDVVSILFGVVFLRDSTHLALQQAGRLSSLFEDADMCMRLGFAIPPATRDSYFLLEIFEMLLCQLFVDLALLNKAINENGLEEFIEQQLGTSQVEDTELYLDTWLSKKHKWFC